MRKILWKEKKKINNLSETNSYLGFLDKLKAPLYKYNQTIVKELGYGDFKALKVTTMNVLRTAGLDVTDKKNYVRCSVNDSKLNNNITRARNQIYELACCNQWDLFVTFTIDSKKFNRQDLEKYHKAFVIFLRDYGKKYGIKIQFLLIPELHNDGNSWHIHGLFYGLPISHLHQFQIGDVMGKKLAEKVKNGDIVYNWLPYQNKFGFCSLEPIKNHEAISRYITKYINKDLSKSVTELNAHLYYRSRNLNKATTIARGTLTTDLGCDFVNEYCSIKTLPYSQETVDFIKENII